MNKRNAGHTLISDFDNREPKSDFYDIETGRFLDALQKLPMSIRQMLQDSDMHCVLDKYNRIIKIIKKRDPEFLAGQFQDFILTSDGKRIPVSEEEMDNYLQLSTDPEDVFSGNVELTSYSESSVEDEWNDEIEDLDEVVTDDYDAVVTEEFIPPMDRWDLIFDATEFVQHMERLLAVVNLMKDNFEYLLKETDYFKKESAEKLDMLNDLFDGGFIIGKTIWKEALEFMKASTTERDLIIEKYQDELIYSADLFPPMADKRFRSSIAKEIQCKVAKLDKSELGRLTSTPVDVRKKNYLEVMGKLSALPLGSSRMKLLVRAQAMQKSRINALRDMRGFRFEPEDMDDELNHRWVCVANKTKQTTPVISKSETNQLWAQWRFYQAAGQSGIEIPEWLFRKQLAHKLTNLIASEQITREEADTRFQEVLKKVYKTDSKQIVRDYVNL